MTNQMKVILKLSLIASGLTLAFSICCLFIGEIGFLQWVSYIVIAVSALIFISSLVIYLNTKAEDRALKKRIAYYRLLKKLRDKAVLDFYNKFGLKPQYNKEGKLLTPDEFLGILTKLDKEGKLDPSIYEKLGILPQFDKDGKEIPLILVLKHLIKSIKMEGVKDIKKLKGLYAKGTKKEKKTPPKKESSGDKKKGKKKEKQGGGSAYYEDRKRPKLEFGKKKKTDDKQKESKQEEQKDGQKQTTTEPGPKPIITKIDPRDIKRDDYFSRMARKDAQDRQNLKYEEQKEEEGETTPE